ncbi:afadin- and alpha-actinin-binding protein isoform X2 [Notolabrus celidotus]|uniref:afadin- and alpha-actinin-binding protein isoform X2 n=1 Tax=Notolabrus celidotus TaxID=1203425 RepID=UPI00148FEE90|nr:afadin- and alpha-actinin-binding protein isoform X2 [Notolabrus celidotus]
MASRFAQRRVGRCSKNSATDSNQLLDPTSNPPSALSLPLWADREENRGQRDSVRELLKEKDEHAARLHDMLKYEQAKSTRLQLRCNQQEAELKRREQLSNRLKERLSQLPDRHRDKGPSVEVLNFPRGSRSRREEPIRSFRQEEAALRLMLERREAELREAMKLRHSLTTVLHALRVDMEHTLSDVQDEAQTEDTRLDQAEVALGDHVTGGVVQSWRQVQRRLCYILPEDHFGVGTDHDKLLARFETELKESQQLVRLQQQLLQDSLASPVPSELADAYFLEEWERLRMHWAEFDHQRKTFERERQSFTDAAIRLSYERRDFEHQRASLLKQEYLCDSPLFNEGSQRHSRRGRSSLDFSGLGPTSVSGCLPISPSSSQSGTAAVSGSNQGTVRVQTPSTPDLYSALNLSYKSRESDHPSEIWDVGADGMVHAPHVSHLDWSF